MAQPIAKEGIGFVGAILHMGDVVFFKKRQHLAAGDVQHGADALFHHGSDAAQTLQPRATHQMHQQRFRIIIGGVGGGDDAVQGVKIAVAGIPRGGFQTLFAGDYLGFSHKQGDVEPLADVPDELLIPLGFLSPQVMVEMGGGKPDVQLVLQ